MEHTNEAIRKILNDEYADYHYNGWHYDREYKMLEKAFEAGKNLATIEIPEGVKVVMVGAGNSPDMTAIKEVIEMQQKEIAILSGIPSRLHEVDEMGINEIKNIDIPHIQLSDIKKEKRTNHERQPSRPGKRRKGR
jgi:hypothetical protein